MSFAKINLALSVGSRDERTGLHPIVSWMAPIAFADDVEFSADPSGHASLSIAWDPGAPHRAPIDWTHEQDLSMRALRLVERHTGSVCPVRITITKRVPLGAGLGGGSACAAAVLVGLNDRMDLGLDPQTLAHLGSQLGSDVSFQIDPCPAIVSGFGESIERTSPIRSGVLLLCPAFGCSTAQVYGAYDDLGARPLQRERIEEMVGSGDLDSAQLFNDLLEPAESVRPELRTLRTRIQDRLSQPVHLTGSGSTLFVLGEEQEIQGWATMLQDAPVACIATRLL